MAKRVYRILCKQNLIIAATSRRPSTEQFLRSIDKRTIVLYDAAIVLLAESHDFPDATNYLATKGEQEA